jgi:Dihaem cytochrome c
MRTRETFVLLSLILLSMFLTFCTSSAKQSTGLDQAENIQPDFTRRTASQEASTYRDECGRCHHAYQPELLPAASWMKLLDGTDDHFGEGIEIDSQSKISISQYLRENAAERSPTKIAAKIVNSLNGQTPDRISDVPYIKRKHHGIDSTVFRRPSIGSLANCPACHVSAGKGIYKEHDVRIPE